MPRRARSIRGGLVYHVLNRANARATVFEKEADYWAFERVLAEAQRREPLRLLGYCLMPNHWHLLVWPKRGADRQVSEFMSWLTITHTQRWHAHHHTSGTGHVYQGRFKSFPVQRSGHLLKVLRYVERNPLRAGLVSRAEDWPWSSLGRWMHETAGGSGGQTKGRDEDGVEQTRPRLSPWPVDRPANWAESVNVAQSAEELESLRRCVNRGRPFGDSLWRGRLVARLGLEHTIRPRGRPRASRRSSRDAE